MAGFKMRIAFILIWLLVAALLGGCSVVGGILQGTGSVFNKAGQTIKGI